MVSEMSKNLNGMVNFGGCLMVVCMFFTLLLIGGVGSKITPNGLGLDAGGNCRMLKVSTNVRATCVQTPVVRCSFFIQSINLK